MRVCTSVGQHWIVTKRGKSWFLPTWISGGRDTLYPGHGIDSSDYGPTCRKIRYLLPGFFGHFLVTIFTILVRFWPHMALSWPHFDPKSTPLTLSGPILTNFRPNLIILWHFQFLALEPPAIFFLARRYLLQPLSIQSRGYLLQVLCMAATLCSSDAIYSE